MPPKAKSDIRIGTIQISRPPHHCGLDASVYGFGGVHDIQKLAEQKDEQGRLTS
jgi:hypothetical protein